MKKFNITWTAPANDGGAAITGHDVGYTPSGGSETVVATGSTSAAYTLGGLTDDVEYSVRVRAENSAGKGAWSDAVVQVAALSFAPSDITGLQLWLDASDASTLYDATTGGSLVAADGAVKRWEDKSGNDRHATESTNGPQRKTSKQNGRDTLLFDGSNAKLALASDLNLGTAQSVFVAFTPASTITTTAAGSVLSGGAFTGSGTSEFLLALGNVTGGMADERVGFFVVAETTPAGVAQVYAQAKADEDVSGALVAFYSFTTSGDTFVGRLNGASSFTSTTSISGADNGGVGTWKSTRTNYPTKFRNIGFRSTAFFNGDICEIIIYNSALSDTDREAVENYLLQKWAIS